jgi:dienelactone hydrolase
LEWLLRLKKISISIFNWIIEPLTIDMKTRIIVFTLLMFSTSFFAQLKKAEDFGYRQLETTFRGDPVVLLIKSKKGEEQKRKPLLLFCQGSLPQPLIKYTGDQCYAVFPFDTSIFEDAYHLVIISKPYVPAVAEASTLGPNFVYQDPITSSTPTPYSERNLLDYYVDRNVFILDFLAKLPFIDSQKIVVAGHSEGSTVAAKLATQSKRVTHLIYASGNPFGRIMAMIGKDRATEKENTSATESEFDYWEQVVANKDDLNAADGDTFKATYDFSMPPMDYLERLKIPVLVCYGTKDYGAPFNDYLRVAMIRQQKKNFTFKSYLGLEHNFFPLKENGQPDYDRFNWDKVATDWLLWLGH